MLPVTQCALLLLLANKAAMILQELTPTVQRLLVHVRDPVEDAGLDDLYRSFDFVS